MIKNQSWIACDFDDDDDEIFVNVDTNITSTQKKSSANETLRKRKLDSAFKSEPRKLRRQVDEDDALWSQSHEPKSAQELAVHPKKVEEVRGWIQYAFSKKSSNGAPILLLKGPPGSGKTATVQVLAKELNIKIQEWIAPNEVAEFKAKNFDDDDNTFTDAFDKVPYVSQKVSFRNFLLRANRYQVLEGLEIGGSNSSGRQLVILEEIPSFANRDPAEFHSILSAYKASSKSFPMIIIQSESNKEEGRKKRKKTVLNEDFVTEMRLDEISFNPVTATNLVKALKVIATSEASAGVRSFKVPDKDALTSLAESSGGDVRGAINALQFACLKDVKNCFNSRLNGNSKKTKNTRRQSSNDAPSTLSSIGSKDPSLDMFHALGKVLYSKRLPNEKEPFNYPKGDASLGRCRLQLNPEEVLMKAPMSEESFACFLHQHYPDFFTSMTDLSTAAEHISLSDGFFNEWTTSGKMSLSEYGGLITIRGICYNNTKVASQNGLKKFFAPDWYQKNRLTNSRIERISSTFRQHSPSTRETATVLLPMLASHFPNTISSDLVDIGAFPGYAGKKLSQMGKKQDTFLAPQAMTRKVDKVENEDDEECDFNIEED